MTTRTESRDDEGDVLGGRLLGEWREAAPGDRAAILDRYCDAYPHYAEDFRGMVETVVSLQGAHIVKPTTTHIVPTQGHIHVYLDNKIISMNYGLTQTVGGLTPGSHVLQAEFVASDHLPWNPRIIAAVSFTVKP